MAVLTEGRRRHLIIRALVTASVALRQQEERRQPSSDIYGWDILLEELCGAAELERYVQGLAWDLGLVRRRQRGGQR